MSDDSVLEPIEVKETDFYGDKITAALVKIDAVQQVYVPIRPLCDYLGLNWSGQFERIKRNPVMETALGSVRVTRTQGKRSQNLAALQLEMLPGWLFGIDAQRVKPELKDKIIRYQRECFKILWQAFQNEAIAVVGIDPFAVEPKEYQPSQSLVEIEKMGLAIVEMARQQMELERRVDQAHERLDKAGRVVKNLQQRMDAVEGWIGSRPNYITDRQAQTISEKVKELAAHLAKARPVNHYQQVFSEIYKRFHVSGYKQLTQEQYPAVLEFLNNWHDDPNTPHQANLF
jgi:hypothetical protein